MNTVRWRSAHSTGSRQAMPPYIGSISRLRSPTRFSMLATLQDLDPHLPSSVVKFRRECLSPDSRPWALDYSLGTILGPRSYSSPFPGFPLLFDSSTAPFLRAISRTAVLPRIPSTETKRRILIGGSGYLLVAGVVVWRKIVPARASKVALPEAPAPTITCGVMSTLPSATSFMSSICVTWFWPRVSTITL